MEISNRINTYKLGILKPYCESKKKKVAFKGTEQTSSASAMESLAKAKIILDNAYSKPISLDEKLELLKQREVKKENIEIFITQDDETFKKMITYLDYGITPDEIFSIVSNKGNITTEKAVELTKYNIPYHFAKDLFGYYGVEKDRIEFLKKANFDFSDKLENFQIEDYKLKKVLKDDTLFEKLNEIYSKNVDANMALIATTDLKDDEYKELLEILSKKKEINNSAATAYYLKDFSEKEIEALIKTSKKHKLDFNDYNFWIKSRRYRGIERTNEMLELGLPKNCLELRIYLDNEKLKDVLKIAQEKGIPEADVIEIYQITMADEERKTKTCDLIKSKGIDKNLAYQLSQYPDNIIDETIGYIKQGLNTNNALSLALSDKNAEDKKKVIGLLDIFGSVYDAESFLSMNLNDEDSKKVLDLMKKGANLYLATFCLKSEAAYKEVNDLYDTGVCETLEGIYGGFEDSFLKEMHLLRIGVPKENLNLYSCLLNDEQIQMLENGVKFEDVRAIEKYEEEGNDCEQIKTYMKKGASFSAAKEIKDRNYSGKIPEETILENIHKDLEGYQILTLASLEEKNGKSWLTKEEKETLRKFLIERIDPEKVETYVDFGFINESAYENFKHLRERGITSRQADNAVIISQLEFKNEAQLDKVAEMLKRKIPFSKILFAMNDDKSFISAINSEKREDIYSNYTTINSALIKFYKMGLSEEEISLIAEKGHYKSTEDLNEIEDYIKRGHSVDNAIKINGYSTRMRFSGDAPDEKEKQDKELLSELILEGCSYDYLKGILYDSKKSDKLKKLLKDGVNPKLAEKLTAFEISPNDKEKVNKIIEIENSTINEDLKKLSGNPMLYTFIDELYNFNNYNEYQLRHLLRSNVSLDEIKESGKIFIKSPLKQAMKRPNLYLSGIPIEDTEKINGEYPKLSDEKQKQYQQKMLEFFKSNITEITRTLKYLDIDTFNQLMDKRTNIFREQLEQLNKMDNKHFGLVSKITKCRKEDGKLLSSKEKIDLSKIVLYHQLGYLDTSYLLEMVKDGTVNVEHLNKMIFEKLTETIGLTEEEASKHKNKLNFDEEYMFLLLRTQKSADFMWIKEILGDSEKIEAAINELQELLEDLKTLPTMVLQKKAVNH